MTKLDALTPAQIARFPEFIAKWTKIGLSTEPADRPRAEAGIRLAYEAAGLAQPKQIVWCGSPLSAGLTRAIVMGLCEVNIGDNKSASVWDSVTASVMDSVRDSVWDSVTASVSASVRDSVWDSVWDRVWDSVWDSVTASVMDSVGASVGASGYGQHDANWLAFFDYFRDAAGMSKITQKLAGMLELAQSANWWLPHKNICWVCERHNVLNRDDDGRLHCEDGPALAYPDGFAIWAISGVRVDEQIIMRPETQTIDQIAKEENEEIRRIRAERFGWTRYLKESGAKVVDKRLNDVDGTEERLMQLGDGSRRLLCACRSTARVYAVGVPRELQTCEQSQTWMAGGSSLAVKRNVIGAS